MTKYISCEVCDRRKGPLFAVKGKNGKYYVCKDCLNKLRNKFQNKPQ